MSAVATVAVDPERVIVNTIEEALGRRPLILCGSRATGEAYDRSDYDVLVVVPTPRIPFLLRRMNRAAERLERELGLPVSINPLPPLRLRRPGRSLLPWKIRLEGKVLASPPGFRLGAVTSPRMSEAMRSSYAMAGIRYLIQDLSPEQLGHAVLPIQLERAVRKALRHAVQLRLLRTGRYASSLGDALSLIGPDAASELGQLAETCDRPEAWFATRDLLLEDTGEPPISAIAMFFHNLQYAVLSAMRGRGLRTKALIESRPIGHSLERAVVLLARSIGPGGSVDKSRVSAAVAALPAFLRPREADWTALRDAVEREWPEANPLLGL
jgi:predicted nucleotidyltransferase